jgi:hypothetical protein
MQSIKRLQVAAALSTPQARLQLAHGQIVSPNSQKRPRPNI